MAEISDESNEMIRHSRTNSSTSSNSNEDCLVLSVAGLQQKSKRPNSGNNNTKLPSSSESIEAQLRAELEQVRLQLKTKDEECQTLEQIRVDLESEVSELTASLFEEANKMVGEANIKAAASERSLAEANLKIDGLVTEVAGFKDMVLTSTPSKPNRHLHPQISGDKKLAAAKRAGLDLSNCSLEEVVEEKWVDPVSHKEYMTWKKSPTLKKDSSKFLQRLFQEDLVPCLTFPNERLTLKVRKAVEDNSLCISPIKVPKSNGTSASDNERSGELPKHCALFDAPLVCQFQVILEEAPSEQFEICALARNRIAAACECVIYLRYICEGLVKAHHNEVYWEIVKRRRKVTMAKLGYSPDEE